MNTDCLPGMMHQAQQHTAIVNGVRPLAKDTWAVRIRQPELAQAILPGQFFMLRPANGSDPLLGRPFALYDTYEENGEVVGVEFGFVVVGKLTSIMAQWSPGDEVVIWGPLGNGFPPPSKPNLICVAGGIGQTPFLGVAREALGLKDYGRPLPVKPESVTLCYGVKSQEYVSGQDDFNLPGLDMKIATNDGTSGHYGLVTELLQEARPADSSTAEVFCCGPMPMMKAVADLCAKEGIDCWVSLETPMACGFGACFSCVAKVRDEDGWDYKRTCVEGPIFRAQELVW